MYATTKLVAVPLRYGAGVKGKILEALYNGAAVVTTSIGAEGFPLWIPPWKSATRRKALPGS